MTVTLKTQAYNPSRIDIEQFDATGMRSEVGPHPLARMLAAMTWGSGRTIVEWERKRR